MDEAAGDDDVMDEAAMDQVAMSEADVADYIATAFDDVHVQSNLGYLFFFRGDDRMMPFATIASHGNGYEQVSRLDRPSVYRLNVGLSRAGYTALFGPPPKGLGPDGVVETGHDFTALDTLLPHPHYAPQSWVCVLRPSAATFERVRPLLAEAYGRAGNRAAGRSGGRGSAAADGPVDGADDGA